MKQRILICGAGGMLGRRLLEAFGDQAVLATARAPTPAHPLDIADPEAVEVCVDAFRPDWIVNAAAYTAVDQAESERAQAFRANADGPRVLARAAARSGARLLHVSTDFVFRGDLERPYEESDPTDAVGAYAESKEAGERAVAEELPGGHVIFRVSWLFGPDGKNFVATILRLGRERDLLRVVEDQRGTPTFTRDAAETMRRVVEADLRGVIHGANHGVVSWCGFAREILRVAGIGTPVEGIPTSGYPTPAVRPKNSALRNRVLETTIGDGMRPWPEALAAYLREIL